MQDKNAETISLKNRLHAGTEIIVKNLQCWSKEFKVHSILLIGEGDGTPLQCSCLENPREGGAWWAAVYGVTQSRTQLK